MNWIKKTIIEVYVINAAITNVIVHCRGEKKKKKKKKKRKRKRKETGETRIGEFRKKLKISEYEISQCTDYKIKWKIGKIFVD